tara:strand:+ start:76 stop:261 length:186 start_codon:yes stop_codon:yes gene_type:complete
MYVNPDDDKVKQLHADIGKTLPEQIKLTKGTPSLYGGGKIKKKYSYRRGGMTTLRKPKRSY